MEVRFTGEFTHRIDENTHKTWRESWSGEVSETVAFAARTAGLAVFAGEGAAENEAAYQAEIEALAAAEAAEADKKAGKSKPKDSKVPADGDDANKLV